MRSILSGFLFDISNDQRTEKRPLRAIIQESFIARYFDYEVTSFSSLVLNHIPFFEYSETL